MYHDLSVFVKEIQAMKTPNDPPDYEMLDHTADARARVRGKTMEALLVNAARAMMDIITDRGGVSPERQVEVRATGRSPEALLVSWLEEINFLHETEKLLFRDFEVTGLTDTEVRGVARGEPVDFTRHALYTDIKAVTFHDLDIKHTSEGLMVEIVFDI